MKTVFCRSAYNYDRNAASESAALVCQDPSRTKQAMKDECDINEIVKRFNLTGRLPENVRPPVYSDFEGIFDFHSAMNAIVDANEAFMAMPSAVRARFHNDPGEFVDFCSDVQNFDEMVKLGLAQAKTVEIPVSEPPASGGGEGEHNSST